MAETTKQKKWFEVKYERGDNVSYRVESRMCGTIEEAQEVEANLNKMLDLLEDIKEITLKSFIGYELVTEPLDCIRVRKVWGIYEISGPIDATSQKENKND